MNYEWDETKRLSNLAKHGIDFLDSDLVFEAIPKVTVGLNSQGDTLCRFRRGQWVCTKATIRGKAVRCISLRVASKNERRLYHETKNS